jgi:hypothetical protein
MDFSSINALLANPLGQLLFVLLTIWSLAWKGVALWRAARSAHRVWFVALLVINSIGVLEIIYIFYFSGERGKKSKE